MSSQILSQFQSFTSTTAEEAEFWLSMNQYDLDRAVESYFDNAQCEPNTSSSLQSLPQQQDSISSAIPSSTNDIRAPEPARSEVLQAPSWMDSVRNALTPTSDPFQFIGQRVMNNPYAEQVENVWRDDKLAKLFEAPNDILTRCSSIDQLLQIAVDLKKWLLVNIQHSEAFMSHCLNRDVWRNQELKDYINQHFVFTQLHTPSPAASEYLNLYSVKISSLPHVAIIDPRTRLLVWKWENDESVYGQLNSKRMLQTLKEFVLQNSFDDHSAAKLNSNENLIQNSTHSLNSTHSITQPTLFNQPTTMTVDYSALSEDEQLDLAIRASLESDQQKFQTVDGMDKKQPNLAPRIQRQVDLRPLPEEPPAGKTVTQILFNFPDQRRIRRRFNKNDSCQALYDFMLSHLSEEQKRTNVWSLASRMPRKKIPPSETQTIETEGLINSSLFVEAETHE